MVAHGLCSCGRALAYATHRIDSFGSERIGVCLVCEEGWADEAYREWADENVEDRPEECSAPLTDTSAYPQGRPLRPSSAESSRSVQATCGQGATTDVGADRPLHN